METKQDLHFSVGLLQAAVPWTPWSRLFAKCQGDITIHPDRERLFRILRVRDQPELVIRPAMVD